VADITNAAPHGFDALIRKRADANPLMGLGFIDERNQRLDHRPRFRVNIEARLRKRLKQLRHGRNVMAALHL
jgi:hypothetical protein